MIKETRIGTITRFISTGYEENKFYRIMNFGSSCLTCFFVCQNVTTHFSLKCKVSISGLCSMQYIYDSDSLLVGYLFETPKSKTTVLPIFLHVGVKANIADYAEAIIPPKLSILAYVNEDSSTLIVSANALDLQYVIKDSLV